MKITEAIGATNASDTQNRTRCRGSLTNRGFATVAALVIGVTLIGVVLVTTELAITQTRLSKRGESKATALFTADAGLDDAVRQLEYDHYWTGQSSSQTMYSDPSGKTTSFGNFTSTATLSADKFTATVHSVGTLSTGTTSKTVGVIGFKPVGFGDYAIRAKGDVSISGSATITSVSGVSDANIASGGTLTMGNNGSWVSGGLYASGTVYGPPAPYPNQGVVGSYSNYPQPPFPDPATIQSTLQTQAGTTVTSANSAFSGKNGTKGAIITAPAYISGDLKMNSGDKVTFNGTGTVYISGNVSMSGGTILNNLNGVLAVSGTFGMNGGAYYSATPTASLAPDGTHTIAPTLAVFNAGITTGTALSLNGTTGTDESGIVYTANGDLKLNGGNNYRGSFVSGGNVNVNGNFTQIYPDNERSTIYYPGTPSLTFWGEEQ